MMEESQNKSKDKFYIQIHNWNSMILEESKGNVRLMPGQSALVCISRKPLQLGKMSIDKKYLPEIGNTEPINNHKMSRRIFTNLGTNFSEKELEEANLYTVNEYFIGDSIKSALPTLYFNQQNIDFHIKVSDIFKEHISEINNSMVYTNKPFSFRIDNTNFYCILVNKKTKDLYDPEYYPKDGLKPLGNVFLKEIEVLKEYINFGFDQSLEDAEFILVQ
jgi:hypothetical protein